MILNGMGKAVFLKKFLNKKKWWAGFDPYTVFC